MLRLFAVHRLVQRDLGLSELAGRKHQRGPVPRVRDLFPRRIIARQCCEGFFAARELGRGSRSEQDVGREHARDLAWSAFSLARYWAARPRCGMSRCSARVRGMAAVACGRFASGWRARRGSACASARGNHVPKCVPNFADLFRTSAHCGRPTVRCRANKPCKRQLPIRGSEVRILPGALRRAGGVVLAGIF
jgi:hypothetical protein